MISSTVVVTADVEAAPTPPHRIPSNVWLRRTEVNHGSNLRPGTFTTLVDSGSAYGFGSTGPNFPQGPNFPHWSGGAWMPSPPAWPQYERVVRYEEVKALIKETARETAVEAARETVAEAMRQFRAAWLEFRRRQANEVVDEPEEPPMYGADGVKRWPGFGGDQ
jgi:hypothetical protein